jgi:hypothetical protein
MLKLAAFLYVFWLLFVAAMNIYRVQLAHGLTTTIRVFAAPVVLAAYLVDVIANIFIASVVFAELPREWLVTSRLHRYMTTRTDWRFKASKWLCSQLLDPLDPTGKHCE